MRFGSSR